MVVNLRIGDRLILTQILILTQMKAWTNLLAFSLAVLMNMAYSAHGHQMVV